MKKLLSICTLLGLAALPLAAQEPPAEDPMADPYAVETEAYDETEAEPASEDVVATETETMEQDTAAVDVDAEADVEIDAADEELPRTASPLALMALIGSAGAAAGFGVRRARK